MLLVILWYLILVSNLICTLILLVFPRDSLLPSYKASLLGRFKTGRNIRYSSNYISLGYGCTLCYKQNLAHSTRLKCYIHKGPTQYVYCLDDVHVTMAWYVIRLWVEEWPPIRKVAESILNKQTWTPTRVVLLLRGWARY